MTRRAVERLGAMTYGLLIIGIFNRSLREVYREDRDNWVIFTLILSVGLIGLAAWLCCLVIYLNHLFTANRRVGTSGKALWLVLLLFGSLLTMPVYWYLYLVRERLADQTAVAS